MGKLSMFLLLVVMSCTSCRQMFKPQNTLAGDSSTVHNVNDFTGNWFWESADTTRSFKIVIIRKADSVYGQYCAAYDKGNRLDCEFNTTYNMFGHKVGDSIVLQFRTFYGGKNGEAILTPKGNTLNWRISRMPTGGDCFAPPTAVMFRNIQNW